jgi:hypothetical protein
MATEFATDDMIAADLRRLAQQLRDGAPDITRRVVVEELERIARILDPARGADGDAPVMEQSEV